MRVDPKAGILHRDEQRFQCAIGKNGVLAAAAKCEGDRATPLGAWAIRGALLRLDRIAPLPLRIPWRWLRPGDGWSDDITDPAYNRPVRLPHPFSAERLWREDALYDLIVVLGHNDDPPVAGRGSAIFLHCWNEGAPTEGCVAIPRDALVALLPLLRAGEMLTIG